MNAIRSLNAGESPLASVGRSKASSEPSIASRPLFELFPTLLSIRAIVGDIVALIAGGLVLFMEMWTLVPAPTLPTLALAVVVPEVTPWAVAACIAAGVVAELVASGWARNVGVYGSALALGCALAPWCLLPSTIDGCEREMRTAFGPAYASVAAARAVALTSPPSPYSVLEALRGTQIPAVIRTQLNLPVRTRDGARLALDVFAPLARGRRPAIIIIYGGAWIFGTRADSAQLARHYAGEGYTAIAVDYRHAPTHRFPTQLNDVRDAIAEIARHASAWDVDPGRVALLGRSAGAQLALLAAYTPEPLTIRGVVGYYAPTDLVQGYRVPPQPDPADVDRILRAYIGGTPEDRMAAYSAASPIAHIRSRLAPTLLIGGGRDELVRLAFQHHMRDGLRAQGVPVAALEFPWSNHAFDTIGNGTAGQLAQYYTDRFMTMTLMSAGSPTRSSR